LDSETDHSWGGDGQKGTTIVAKGENEKIVTEKKTWIKQEKKKLPKGKQKRGYQQKKEEGNSKRLHRPGPSKGGTGGETWWGGKREWKNGN